MEKLSNFVNYLKHGKLEFDCSKPFIEVLREISSFDIYGDLGKEKQEEFHEDELNKTEKVITKKKSDGKLKHSDKQSRSVNVILNNTSKIDFTNPKSIIDNLQEEFLKMRHGDSKDFRKREKDSHKKVKRNKLSEFTDDIVLDDIDVIRKRQKLLEFVVLQKARNKYFLNKRATEAVED